MKLDIYNQDGTLKVSVSPSDSSTCEDKLMAVDALSLSFTLYNYVPLDVNNYIDFSGVRYTLPSAYEPQMKSRQQYVYNVKFYGPIADAGRVKMVHLTDGDFEPVFSLYGTPREHLELAVQNLNRITGRAWKTGQCIEAGTQNIEYNNLWVLDALNKQAETFETEWWISGNDTLNLIRCERDESVELGYMQGLTDLDRTDNDTDVKFFTRLIPLGSTKNIDPERYGFSRLQLPGKEKFIEKNTGYGLYEHVEETAFEDIFPRYTGKVTSVRSEEKENENGKFTVYYIGDSNMYFDPNEYEIPKLVKRVSFQSGELQGREFDVNFHSDTKEFEIINQYPAKGNQLPGGNLVPSEGDEYIPWNFRMPDEYYPKAEKEYETAVHELLDQYSADKSIYKGNTDYTHINRNKISLRLGSRVRLLSDKYFKGKGYQDSRITMLSRKINNPSIIYLECTNMLGKTWKQTVDSSVQAIKTYMAGQENGGTGSNAEGSTATESDAKLKKDIIVTSQQVGFVKTGNTILAGTTWEAIFRKIFYEPAQATLTSRLSTSTDVEYGSDKGFITYTAARNGQGKMKEAYYDNIKANTLQFSAEANGKQTAVRKLTGVYTVNESYRAIVVYEKSQNGELPEKTLTDKISVNVRRKWFAGVCASMPTTSAQVRALSASGLYMGVGSYKFTISNYKIFVICIPSGTLKEVSQERYQYNFMDLDSAATPHKIQVEGAGGSASIEYTMYVFSTETTSTETDNFTFKTN